MLHMEGAGERIFHTGDEIPVFHRIHDGGLLVGDHGLVAVRAVRGGGADLRGDDAELLVHVVLVLVLRHEGAVAHAVQLLEDGDGPAAQAGGGQGRFHDLIAVRSLRGELVDDGDGLIVHGDGFAGFRVHDRGGEPVGFACGEAGVGHFVRDPHVTGHDGVVSVGGVVGVGGDGNGGLGLVVEGAVVVHHAVAGGGDGGVDELVAFVGGAAQLLDAVGVVGERAVPVVRAGQGALTGEAEPDACGGIEQNTVDGFGFAKRPVVGVGVLRVMVPRGRGVEIPVGVGDDDVGFPGGQAGELEGDSGHPVGAVPGFLAEGEIAAHHLFRNLRRLVGDGVLYGLFLNLLEAQEVAVEHVAFRRFGFVHDEGAARDHGLSAGVPVQVIP